MWMVYILWNMHGWNQSHIILNHFIVIPVVLKQKLTCWALLAVLSDLIYTTPTPKLNKKFILSSYNSNFYDYSKSISSSNSINQRLASGCNKITIVLRFLLLKDIHYRDFLTSNNCLKHYQHNERKFQSLLNIYIVATHNLWF